MSNSLARLGVAMTAAHHSIAYGKACERFGAKCLKFKGGARHPVWTKAWTASRAVRYLDKIFRVQTSHVLFFRIFRGLTNTDFCVIETPASGVVFAHAPLVFLGPLSAAFSVALVGRGLYSPFARAHVATSNYQ